MTTRFFSSSPIQGKTALLTGPEAHHLKDVMRIPVDSQVILFDGSWDANVIGDGTMGIKKIRLYLKSSRAYCNYNAYYCVNIF